MQFSNQQVARVFREIADSMEVLGENRFKYQAYARAADTIDELPTSLYDYLASETLDDIPGVGPAISAKITELLTTGRMGFRERLRAQVPDGVLDVVRVPGVGPKTALRQYRELDVMDAAALEAAAREGRIRQAIEAVGFRVATSATPIKATMSLGVACFPLDGKTRTDLVHAADVAIYQAKLHGRNRVVLAQDIPQAAKVNLAPMLPPELIVDAPAATPPANAAVAGTESLPGIKPVHRADKARL